MVDEINKIGTIFRTRKLKQDEIVHELHHVRFHSWSQEKVNFWTDLLLKSPKSLFNFRFNQERFIWLATTYFIKLQLHITALVYFLCKINLNFSRIYMS